MICRKCGISNKAQNAIGFVVVLAGVLLLVSGLCILVISGLRQ